MIHVRLDVVGETDRNLFVARISGNHNCVDFYFEFTFLTFLYSIL